MGSSSSSSIGGSAGGSVDDKMVLWYDTDISLARDRQNWMM